MVISDSNYRDHVVLSDLSSDFRQYIIHNVSSDMKKMVAGVYHVHIDAMGPILAACKKSRFDKTVDISGLTAGDLRGKIKKLYSGGFASSVPSRNSAAFSALHLTHDAPRYIVDAVYRAMAVKSHPDSGGDHEQFVKVQQAYDQIKAIFASRGD